MPGQAQPKWQACVRRSSHQSLPHLPTPGKVSSGAGNRQATTMPCGTEWTPETCAHVRAPACPRPHGVVEGHDPSNLGKSLPKQLASCHRPAHAQRGADARGSNSPGTSGMQAPGRRAWSGGGPPTPGRSGSFHPSILLRLSSPRSSQASRLRSGGVGHPGPPNVRRHKFLAGGPAGSATQDDLSSIKRNREIPMSAAIPRCIAGPEVGAPPPGHPAPA